MQERDVVRYVVLGADLDLRMHGTWEVFDHPGSSDFWTILFEGIPVEDEIRHSGVGYVRVAACFASGDWGTSRWIDVSTRRYPARLTCGCDECRPLDRLAA